jgi:hypothetical protein
MEVQVFRRGRAPAARKAVPVMPPLRSMPVIHRDIDAGYRVAEAAVIGAAC